MGMTRARKRLFLSYANMRRRMGMVEEATPSRFLLEIPPECLEGAVEGISEAEEGGLAWDFPPAPSGAASARFWKRGVRPEAEDYSQEEIAFRVGARVVHEDFGRGIVRKVEGSGENLRVTVLFDNGSERKFLARYAPMRPLG